MNFFLVVILLYAGSYLYLGIRYVNPLKLSGKWNILAYMVIAGCALLPFLHFWLSHQDIDNTVTHIISLVAFSTLGFVSLLLIMTLLRDVVYTAGLIIHRLRRKPVSRNTRHGIISVSNRMILIVTVLLMFYGTYEALLLPRVREVRLPVDGLPAQLEGFRIVQITDIHIGSVLTGRFLERVVDRVNSLDADVVVITGDLIDGSVSVLADDVASISRLRAPHGVFFTTGNHEYYYGAREWIAEIERLGVDVLLNEHRLIEKDGETLVIAGVTDYSANSHLPGHRSNPRAALYGAPSSTPSILLAHQPRSIFDAAAAGYDIQLSGHTHGGQYMPWNLFVPLQQPYTAGLYRHNGVMLYVSRGTGFWGPPLRIGIPSEITHIILTSGLETVVME